MLQLYETNTLGPLRVVEAFLPLLDMGEMKRLCFITSDAGSINACGSTSSYGYRMSKAALNMGVKILFNRLRPEGYTFRLYSPSQTEGQAGVYAVEYFLRNRSFEPHDPKHSDENRLVLRDWEGREWPW